MDGTSEPNHATLIKLKVFTPSTFQGMNQLRQSAVKPRIKPWMDTFVCHDIEENQVNPS